MTATTALGSAVASVSWAVPTVIDNSGVMISAGSSQRPGDEFGIGSTTVSYVAVDGAGNSGICEFEVIVTGEFLFRRDLNQLIHKHWLVGNCAKYLNDMSAQLGSDKYSSVCTWTSLLGHDNITLECSIY